MCAKLEFSFILVLFRGIVIIYNFYVCYNVIITSDLSTSEDGAVNLIAGFTAVVVIT